MMNTPAWKPSLTWHARTLGVILAVCVAVFAALCGLTARLPAPYQPHTTAPGTTPWNE